MDIGSAWNWLVTNWSILFLVLTTIAALVFAYLAIRKPRWPKYSCRGLPYERIFRGKEYGYDPDTFLKEAKSVELALTRLTAWYDDNGKPLLLRGVTGVGKSRLVTEFIGSLGMGGRLRKRVLMPTPHEMNERLPPVFASECVLFLNDLHEFRDSVSDWKLRFYVEDKKFKVVATIPAEKYDSNWAVLSGFIWDEVSLETWTSEEGRRLANSKKITFEPRTFKGTPLSILAPDTQLKRSYDLLSPGGKAVLRALKIVKTHLGCYADYDLISALQSSGSKFGHEDFLEIISKGFWCKTDDSKCMLADGIEDFVQYNVSMNDAVMLQLVLMGGK